jgi:hypothetical protein
MNLGFGYFMQKGDYNDLAISDNGDLVKVMTTVYTSFCILPWSSRLQKSCLLAVPRHECVCMVGSLTVITLNSKNVYYFRVYTTQRFIERSDI